MREPRYLNSFVKSTWPAVELSSPEALAWSESCRSLYSDFGIDYGAYALGELSDRCFVIPLR